MKRKLLFILSLFGLAAFLGTAQAFAEHEMSLVCTKDTYITKEDGIDKSKSDLYNICLSNSSLERIALFEFDLSAVPEDEMIRSAKLSFYLKEFRLSAARTIQAYEAPDQLWVHDVDYGSGVTGQNAPEFTVPIQGASVKVQEHGFYEMDITSYINQKHEAGVQKVNIALKVEEYDGMDNLYMNLESLNVSREKAAHLQITSAARPSVSVVDDSCSSAWMEPGQAFGVSVELKNNSQEASPVTLLMGLYNAQNNLAGVQMQSTVIPAGEAAALGVQLTMPEDVRGHRVKVFVWEGLERLRPICPPIIPDCKILDELVTTKHTEWMSQLHLISPEEVQAGIKGGEAAQIVYGMDAADSNPEHLLLVTDTAGVWRSADGGQTWCNSSDGLNLAGGVDVAYDPDDETIAYVLASPNSASNPQLQSKDSGVWKSEDGGRTWRHVLHTEYYRAFSNKLIAFGAKNQTDARTMYVGTHSEGLWKSEDGGETFSRCGAFPGTSVYDVYADDAGVVIAATTDAGVLRSDDGGQSWTEKNNGLPGKRATSVAVNPGQQANWFAVVNGQVYKSMDSGESWQYVDVPRTYMHAGSAITKVLFGANRRGGTPTLYIGINGATYSTRYSKDLGESWELPALDNTTAFVKTNNGYFSEAMAVHPTDPDTAWVPFDTTIYKTADGGETFTPSTGGFSGFRASDFLFDEQDAGNIIIAGIDRGLAKAGNTGVSSIYPAIHYLTDDATNNIRYGSGNAKTVHAIARDPQNPQHLIMNVGNWGSEVILKQSFDGGNSWQEIAGTENKTSQNITYHPQDSNVIYAGKNFSADGGATWTVLERSVEAVSPVNGDVVWAKDNSSVYKSTDRGQSWQRIAANISGVQRLTADIAEEGRLWVGTFQSGIYRIDPDGVTHITDENGLIRNVNNQLGIFDIAQNPHNPQHLVAGGCDNYTFAPTAGLFESLDGGETWHLVPGITGTRDIWRVEFHPSRPHVYIGTSSGTFIYDYTKFHGA